MHSDDPSEPEAESGPADGSAGDAPGASALDRTVELGGIESQMRVARVLKGLLGDAASPAGPLRVGRYRITRKLGQGAMGVVYAGHDESLDREVGIKVLQSSMAKSDAARRRLTREAQAMARLSHPHIAHVYEVGEHEGQVYIAMELVAGQTLREWQAQCERSAAEILAVHLQAGRGLAAAHEVGIVHRDFKPDNVMVDAHGRARVMDFGLARHDGEVTVEHTAIDEGLALADSGGQISAGTLTTVGTVMGTPAYMAPEQLMGQRVDHRADQFSFCVALYEALYGVRPFGGTTMATLLEAIRRQQVAAGVNVRPALAPGLNGALRRGLGFDPAQRHDSMTSLLATLEAASRHKPASRRTWWLAGGLATTAVGLTVAATMMRTGESPLTEVAATPAVPHTPPPADPWAEILADSQLPELLPEPLPGDPAQVTVHRLRNGLTVYLVPKASAAIVQTAIVIRADAMDEAPRQAGISSLLPHVLDGGVGLGSIDPVAEAPALAYAHAALEAVDAAPSTEQRQAAIVLAMDAVAIDQRFEIDGEAQSLAEDLGIDGQPQVRGVGTRYLSSIPRNRLAGWAALSAERLTRPAFREFPGAVEYLVEMRREDAGDAIAGEVARLLGAATGWPLGDAEQVRALVKLPFSPMREFWRDYYRPNNTAIVLVGEVTATEVLPILEAAFGHWEPAPIPARRVLPRLSEQHSTVVDEGQPCVTFAWPRRDSPHELETLGQLLRESRFVQRWLDRDGRARQIRHRHDPNLIQLSVAPTPGSSLADAEAAARALLETMERGGLAPQDVRIAHRDLELEVAVAGATSEDLALQLADSFARRVQWRDHPASSAELILSGETIAAATRALQQDGPVVVRRENGPSTSVELPTLVLPESEVPRGFAVGPSKFGAALRDAPVSELEPQFLVRGETFTEQRYGAGRIIAVAQPSGLLRLRWILPRGVADDPWICDAWRARTKGLEDDPRFDGITLETVCTAYATAIDLSLAARRHDELWPVLEALRAPALDDASALLYFASLREERQRLRQPSERRNVAFAVFALHGEHGVDANLASDEALSRATPALLREALTHSLALAPDILIEGPAANAIATELATRMPAAPLAKGRAPTPIGPRALSHTTIFVMDEPGMERAEILVAQGLDLRTPESRIVSELLGEQMTERFVRADFDLPQHSMPYKPASFDARAIFRPEYALCDAKDVPELIAEFIAGRHRTLTVAEYEQAHRELDGRLRARRRFGIEAAAYVWSWRKVGTGEVDPALAEWMALRALDFSTAQQLHREITSVPTIVSISADVSTLDLPALAKLGRVVRVGAEVLRDPEVSDRDVLYDPIAR